MHILVYIVLNIGKNKSLTMICVFPGQLTNTAPPPISLDFVINSRIVSLKLRSIERWKQIEEWSRGFDTRILTDWTVCHIRRA